MASGTVLLMLGMVLTPRPLPLGWLLAAAGLSLLLSESARLRARLL